MISVFSKIFEKILCDQLTRFISKNNILYENQFAFRKGYSTCHALLDFIDKVANAFELNEFLIGVFLDLSKAFDCIDHNILINKLCFYGIRGIPLLLIKSYLSNRKQYVSLGNYYSDHSTILTGVPQGSNLGPLLFLLYINDLPSVSNILSSILFADDTTLFLSGKDPVEVNILLNSEIVKIHKWFLANKLLINFEKTNYVIFKTRNKYVNEAAIKICINSKEIKQVHQVTFLGVIIDENLTWKDHIYYISNKLSKVIGVLNRLKDILPLRILVQLYNSMILPYFNYCIIVWGNCASYLLQKLFLLQKRAVRVITNSYYRAHTGTLFFKLKFLKLYDLYDISIGAFMFSYMYNITTLPDCFNNYFIFNRDINQYSTRNSHKLYVPSFRYNLSRTVIKYKGSIIWNNLPDSLKACPNIV